MTRHTAPPLLLLLLLAACASSSTGSEIALAPPAPEPKEPAWGRIYLRNGLAPIQYFRDNFGGPMVAREVALQFPKREADRFGCGLLPQDEQAALAAANRSAVLVADRGECTFERKARLADQMGAAGLVVVSATDDVHGPVAVLDDDEGDVSIASVMIRRSAGEMLRLVAARTRIFGRLIPMTCERAPYICTPRLEAEKEYVDAFTARSGAIFSTQQQESEGVRVGSFLTATYGSVLSTSTSFPLSTALGAAQACSEVAKEASDASPLSGKAVLLPEGDAGQCSEFQKVSNAQRLGAHVVLLVQRGNATTRRHPSVEVMWHAYNITIPVLAVSSATGLTLNSLVASNLRFAVSNGIADAWELLAKYTQRSAWPQRQQRCSKTLAMLFSQLRALGGDEETEAALQTLFLTVVGGSSQQWEAVANPETHAKDTHEAAEATEADARQAAAQHLTKSQDRDEL
ncbi:hypothetical protein BBJ28_00013531 [Nothophytophthora sp. Chile5]|nr:hypothetical protein BBJ28_00013531 [Nothophytophthora sp. Chile5]